MKKTLLILSIMFLVQCTQQPSQEKPMDPTLQKGKNLMADKGCLACHSLNGEPNVGPSFKKLFGKTESFIDGSSLVVDEAYLKESIRKPGAKVVQRYQPVMPSITLTDEELELMIGLIKSLQ